MMGSCALGMACTHFVPEDDPESEDIAGLIQGAIATWASKDARDSSVQLHLCRRAVPWARSLACCVLGARRCCALGRRPCRLLQLNAGGCRPPLLQMPLRLLC
jgi:hypothetical protein